MSKIKKIQKLYPEVDNELDTLSYLEKVLPKVEQQYGCKIYISSFRNSDEYAGGWSYTIEKKGFSSSKFGNGNKVNNLASAILHAIKI